MKRIVSLFCSFMILFSLCTGTVVAYASNNIPQAISTETTIQPRWVIVAVMTGGIEPGLLGTYKAFGGATSERSTDQLTINCTIQQFTSSGWSDTAITWSTTGTGSCSATKSWITLATGDYRVKVVAVVYDSNGNYIETATHYTTSTAIG